MSRLLSATTRELGQQPEAEPVQLDCDGEMLTLTLDTGTEIWLSLKDFQRALSGELAPTEERDAA